LQVPRLTHTSYIVLGLLGRAEEATPYELKQMVAASVGNFWSIPHAQFYTEPERLARGGYVSERRERGGRRRRRYRLTDRGREALDRWRATPTDEFTELRDPGLLKLFFDADASALAKLQLAAHRRKLEEYETLRAEDPGTAPRGPWLALDAGLAHEREWIRFWSRLVR
jgi:PadR family transcriptional regulator, regulatory protein AphA